ncbi:WD40 repeat domain-containing protein [Micromonospora noduli]|uniref:WD40 repeat domain-containing protein n=1 Tax=Micromonospora noduli TaxID=709876 RepID=UPI00341B6425
MMPSPRTEPTAASRLILTILPVDGCARQPYELPSMPVRLYRSSCCLNPGLRQGWGIGCAGGELRPVAVWDQGQRLGAVGQGCVAEVWNTGTGRHLGTLRPEIESLAATDQVIITGGYDGYLRLWDPQRFTETRAWQGHQDRISSLALAPDGRWFASSGHDALVRVWDTGTGAPLATCTGHTKWVNAVAVSSAARWFASSDDEGVIRLWRMPSGEAWHVLRGHTTMVRTLAIAQDDALIVSGSWDHTARVWDVATGTTVHVLTGHTEPIEVVAISPDGSLVATGGWDHTVRVWDLRTGRCVAGVTVNERVTGCAWVLERCALAATTPSATYLWSYLWSRSTVSMRGRVPAPARSSPSSRVPRRRPNHPNERSGATARAAGSWRGDREQVPQLLSVVFLTLKWHRAPMGAARAHERGNPYQ